MIRDLALMMLGPWILQGEPHDWPQFQGPHANATVPLEGVEFDWSEDGPRVAWSVPTGPGYGGVAVRDGRVFLLDREVGERDVLRVFELEEGNELWSVDYEAPGRLDLPGSRTVPTVTEEHVYTTGAFGHVACFDRANRELVWMVHLGEDYGGSQPIFGWAAAPVVVDDVLIATPLGEDVGLVGLDRFTGEELWVTEPVGFSYSTPRVLDLLGERQVIFVSTFVPESGQDEAVITTISSFDPRGGELIWRLETTGTRVPVPGVVQVGTDRFFLTGGYRGGSSMVQIRKEGRRYEFDVLFRIERGSQVHLPLVHGDHIFLLANENWNNNNRARRGEGGLLCLDLNGEEIWRTGEAPFFGRGNALLAGDHLILQDGFDGRLRVAKASPEGYEQVAEANVFEVDDRRDHHMWAPMALVGRRLLMRSQEELVCLEL